MRFSPGPVLGIETSCDDTAAAVVRDGRVLAGVVAGQEEHLPYEGVVPELASRAHARLLAPVVRKALADAGCSWGDLDGVAATHAPGLIGSLLVGLSFAKGAAAARGLPFVGINHLEAHLVSVLLSDPGVEPPLVALLASGGHTELVGAKRWHDYTILGSTRDDAAGEAFDKVSVLLGLGYPGGPHIQRIAEGANPEAVAFPRARLEPESLDFSFSGLKTAVRNEVARRGGNGALTPGDRADLAASFQEAAVDVLVEKTLRAAAGFGAATVVLAGGVAANASLRRRLEAGSRDRGFRFAVPELRFCGDNGAMVALAGSMRLARGETSSFTLPAVPTLLATSFGR
jgi:N6-L-threonylcarbamoyladenine synthase